MLTCLFVGGHCLLEGVPGLGKTLLVRTLAHRPGFLADQFTPDLMPADVSAPTWSWKRSREAILRVPAGPIFTQICLADEINRATPKTQSAMLETCRARHRAGTVTS